MGVVYFFAGIAKINNDWLLEAQPLKMWLHTAHNWPIVGTLMKADWVAYLFSWSGCLFDLFIIFFLINKRTRLYAYGTVVFFHILTWMLFPIGVFPWVMIVGTMIFLPERFHRTILNRIDRLFSAIKKPESQATPLKTHFSHTFINTALILYISFQLLFPLRYLAYPGHLFWTEEGFRFGWRVMLMEKAGHGYFYLHDPKTGIEWEVPTENHLSEFQIRQMSFQPDMILQYAHHLEDIYADTTISTSMVNLKFKDPEIHAEIYVTLNGRPSQLFVDKKHNLAGIENNLSHRNWLEPYRN